MATYLDGRLVLLVDDPDSQIQILVGMVGLLFLALILRQLLLCGLLLRGLTRLLRRIRIVFADGVDLLRFLVVLLLLRRCCLRLHQPVRLLRMARGRWLGALREN